MGKINIFVNKQLWRIKQTFQVFRAFFDLTQILLLVVMSIGISAWFSLSFEMFVGIVIISFVVLNIVGYVLDVRGFFLVHKIQEFAIAYPEMWVPQVKINAALITKYMKLPIDELDDIIKENMRKLGISEKIIEESIRKK